MSSYFLARSRWASWSGLVAISTATVFLFGRSHPIELDSQRELRKTSLPEEEITLIPTLVNAYELAPIALPGQTPSLSSTTQWNPEPQWKKDLLGSKISSSGDSSSMVGTLSSIPENYPLKPRVKNEPPSIGDAFVSAFPVMGQPSPSDSRGMQPVSPFMAKPVFPSATSNIAQSSIGSPRSEGIAHQPAWPDQTFSQRSTEASRTGQATPLNDLTTPHLLTGNIVRPQAAPKAIANPSPDALPFSKPSSPPQAGKYIVQPLRKTNKT